MKSSFDFASFVRVFLLATLTVTLTACGSGDNGDPGETTIQDSNLSVPTQIQLNAWIGATDTEIILPEPAQGLTLTRSTDRNCDLANYSLCARGQQDIVTEATVVDTAANTTRPAWYWLQQNEQTSNKLPITTSQFSGRSGHQVIIFKNELLLIGGWNGNELTNEIWSSNDGTNWILESSSAAFSARTGHTVVFFNEKLWLIGGLDSSGYINDVWSSPDGTNWTLETVDTKFHPRAWHTVTAFNNRFWLLAGWDGSGQKNDIWSSLDGIAWTEEKSQADFGARAGHRVFSFENKLWVVGGWNGKKYQDGIWSTID